LINIKIYPVFPAIRPTVLRFITTASPVSKDRNETDVIDVSVLLRHVNLDDSGIYRCVIRPWTPSHMFNMEENLLEDSLNLPALKYHVSLSGPRLCHQGVAALPCFSNTRTSSPTIIDAYQTAFLQCVVHNHNRPVTVFWVIGNSSTNSVLITDYLTSNQHNGDRLRRVFPTSPFDFSIELTVNRDTHERSYSCVIAGATDIETTLFTYNVRTINLHAVAEKPIIAHKNITIVTDESTTEKSPIKNDKLIAHDALTAKQIDELRQKNSHDLSKSKTKKEKVKDEDDDDDDLLEFFTREETSTTI